MKSCGVKFLGGIGGEGSGEGVVGSGKIRFCKTTTGPKCHILTQLIKICGLSKNYLQDLPVL